MNQYVTGAIIKRLREERKMTQGQLAKKLHISDKDVSKWETGKGYPDISFIMAVSDYGIQMIKLYPEGNAQARVKMNGTRDERLKD